MSKIVPPAPAPAPGRFAPVGKARRDAQEELLPVALDIPCGIRLLWQQLTQLQLPVAPGGTKRAGGVSAPQQNCRSAKASAGQLRTAGKPLAATDKVPVAVPSGRPFAAVADHISVQHDPLPPASTVGLPQTGRLPADADLRQPEESETQPPDGLNAVAAGLPRVSDPLPLMAQNAADLPAARQKTPESACLPTELPPEASDNASTLTYRFRQWGEQHKVAIMRPVAGSGELMLWPSDLLVQQRLVACLGRGRRNEQTPTQRGRKQQ